jgi:hypothetical protein
MSITHLSPLLTPPVFSALHPYPASLARMHVMKREGYDPFFSRVRNPLAHAPPIFSTQIPISIISEIVSEVFGFVLVLTRFLMREVLKNH